MNNLTLEQLDEYIDIYVRAMICEHIGTLTSLPQTFHDVCYMMNQVYTHGVGTPDGIGSVSLANFYLIDFNILERVTPQTLVEVVDRVNHMIVYTRDQPFVIENIDQPQTSEMLTRLCEWAVFERIQDNSRAFDMHAIDACDSHRGNTAIRDEFQDRSE